MADVLKQRPNGDQKHSGREPREQQRHQGNDDQYAREREELRIRHTHEPLLHPLEALLEAVANLER